MASPGQRRGSCGHVMAGFDLHKKCARCREKKLGDDNCVLNKDCPLCNSLSDTQKSMLATPQYQIRKDKKSGVLVSPSKITVVGPVDELGDIQVQDDSAHAQTHVGSGPSPVPVQQHAGSFVSRQHFDILNNQLEEKFARFEALLSKSNIFSMPKLPVSVENPPFSNTPFINPASDPRATGPVRTPGQTSAGPSEKKEKGGKSKHKKKSKPAAAAGSARQTATSASDPPVKMDVPGPGFKSLDSLPITSDDPPVYFESPSTDKPVPTGSSSSNVTGAGSSSFPSHSLDQPEPVLSDIDVDLSLEHSDKESGEEGELSDTEILEKNEMNYRETVWAVRAFLGWTYIPDFKPAAGDTDNRSDNPWKGKHPIPEKFPLNYLRMIGSVTKWRNLTQEPRKDTHRVLRKQQGSNWTNSLGLPRVSQSGMPSLD